MFYCSTSIESNISTLNSGDVTVFCANVEIYIHWETLNPFLYNQTRAVSKRNCSGCVDKIFDNALVAELEYELSFWYYQDFWATRDEY